jgi:hypothetical protein
LKKSGAKNFFESGPWALVLPKPMPQVKEVFLVLFLQKKNRLLF